mmetsp:Transcript_49078/g.79134  ORF Transcript_49078/g.79134 Transcript_49078/m.79134 type:complete len:101 (+) Transcript_49078:60-362(+)
MQEANNITRACLSQHILKSSIFGEEQHAADTTKHSDKLQHIETHCNTHYEFVHFRGDMVFETNKSVSWIGRRVHVLTTCKKDTCTREETISNCSGKFGLS